jgi:hypothetical protein
MKDGSSRSMIFSGRISKLRIASAITSLREQGFDQGRCFDAHEARGDTSLFTKRFSSVESRVGRHQYIWFSGGRYINQNWFRIVKGYPRLLRIDEGY